MTAGCSKDTKAGHGVTGCLVGYNMNEGVVAVSLPSGKRTILTSHYYCNTVYHLGTQTLYGVSQKGRAVVSLRSGQQIPTVLYRIPDGYDVMSARVLPSHDGRRIHIYSPPRIPSSGPGMEATSIVCDTASGEVLAHCDRLPGLGIWLDDSRFLCLKRFRAEGTGEKRYRSVVGELDVESGIFKPTVELGADPVTTWSFSPSGDRILVYGEGKFRLYALPGGELLKNFDNDELPGRTHDKFCLVGPDHLAIYRVTGPFTSVGTLLVDLNTLKYTKLSRGGRFVGTYLDGMQYLPQCPAWK